MSADVRLVCLCEIRDWLAPPRGQMCKLRHLLIHFLEIIFSGQQRGLGKRRTTVEKNVCNSCGSGGIHCRADEERFAEIFGGNAAAESRRSQENFKNWVLLGMGVVTAFIAGSIFAQKRL
ncbi:hypothetical protein AMECASPLE_022143 [Ameca splendens]|uniref:Uncharacterized protein n=1 Tax=Ameca splendens TaxID=208324 RepID=A0ABV0ZDJ9_9TELE